MLLIEFVISAAIIVFAGSRLTINADILSDRFQIQKAWIGVVLLGMVTSLPEAITSLYAVVSLGAMDLAVGNILGSNVINPMIIVILDFAYRRESVTNKIHAEKSHISSAVLAILLSAIVLGEIFLNAQGLSWAFGSVSLGSFLIAAVYLIGIRLLASLGAVPGLTEMRQVAERFPERPIRKVYVSLFVNAVLVIGAAIWLANVGNQLAVVTGLGQTFFGSIFLALVTSLPEIVVSLSAIKIGSVHLAVGNIFGSNMVNIFILFICEVFYRKGPVLSLVSPAHILTIVLSIILVSIVLIGMNVHNKKKLFGLGWDSLLMIVIFLAGTGLMYRIR
jgi:cation:H+ antiporter